MLAVAITGGYMVDPKKGNPALEWAQKLSIDDIDAALLKDAETNQKATPKENSFESIQRVFGGNLVLDHEAPPE